MRLISGGSDETGGGRGRNCCTSDGGLTGKKTGSGELEEENEGRPQKDQNAFPRWRGVFKTFAFISLTKTGNDECLLVGWGGGVCVFVIDSEAKQASSCPCGIPTTLAAADLHRREAEEERQRGKWTDLWREGESAADSGKVNIIIIC